MPKASRRAAGSASSAGRRTPRRSMIEVPAFLVDELRQATGPSGRRGERDRPVHRRRGRTARRQRGRAAGRVRVGGVPDVARRSQPARRAAPGDDRARGGAAAGVERHAAVVPPHAHGRAAGEVRAAQPRRPRHRARRPSDGGVRDLGRAQLPRRLRCRRCVRAARRDRRLRRPAGRAVLRSGGRVVRRAARRAGRWGAAGDRRSSPRRPVLRDLPQPGTPAAPR